MQRRQGCDVICQSKLPFTPWMQEKTRRLPGIQPVAKGEWLLRDEVFARQMAYREQLLVDRRNQVFRETKASRAAQSELLDIVLLELDDGYSRNGTIVTRPDAGRVDISHDAPLIAAASLVQEDLLIMEWQDGEPGLTAAVLCFPASWTLDEKFTKGLLGIHDTVDEYDANMAKRVQRMFEAIRPEQPLWRANFLLYSDADLYQPRREGATRETPFAPQFVRVERQTLRKLPETGAVVFGIHSYVVPLENLSADEQLSLKEHVKPS